MVKYPRWVSHTSIDPIRFRSPSSRACSLFKWEYLLVKSEAQYYREYINLVELKYGKCSNKLRVFKKLYQDCKEQRITTREIETRVIKMFEDQGKLLLKFSTTVLPYLHPVATKDEVDRANQFIHSVQSAFSNNQDCCVSVEYLVFKFQDGKLTLKEMTVKMLKLLEYKDELIKAYMKFVPQSKHIVASIIIPRRLFPYLAKIVIIVAFVAFGLGFYTMNK